MIVPTANQVALAIVHACRLQHVEPETVFLAGYRNGRARLIAALALVDAGLSDKSSAAAACGFKYNNALSPTRREQLALKKADVASTVEALHAAGFAPVVKAKEPKAPDWSKAEDALLLKCVADGLHDGAIHAKHLLQRRPNAIKKRRLYLLRVERNRPVGVVQGVKPEPAPAAVEPPPEPKRRETQAAQLRAVETPTERRPIDLRHTASEGWTGARLAALKQHASLGLSSGSSATLLGVTKNSVVGKRQRCGLEASHEANRIAGVINTPRPRKPEVKPFAVGGGRVYPQPEPVALPPERPRDPSAALVPLADLERSHCRWPIGDPLDVSFGFCGAHRGEGDTYCGEHARVAYAPRSDRQKKAEKQLHRFVARAA